MPGELASTAGANWVVGSGNVVVPVIAGAIATVGAGVATSIWMRRGILISGSGPRAPRPRGRLMVFGLACCRKIGLILILNNFIIDRELLLNRAGKGL